MGGFLAAFPAHAQGLAEDFARQMARQGFVNIETEATWLGRTRITGTRNGGSREIIVNPNTGEVLRDLWLNSDGQVRAADIDFDDLQDAAEDAAEDSDDDSGSSGSGSSGSGSGSGGSSGSGGGDDGDSDSDSGKGDNSGKGGGDSDAGKRDD